MKYSVKEVKFIKEIHILLFSCMKKYTIGFIVFIMSIAAFSQTTLKITAWPDYTPTDAVFYAAGSFNNWNPADSAYKFTYKYDRSYELVVPGNADFEYKITRGSWSTVECDERGADIQNRSAKAGKSKPQKLKVRGWVDHFRSKPDTTRSANVHIIDSAFYIPQLQKSRRIWIYLPQEYTASGLSYPVMYLHDGQNLFDQITSYSGEWGVDEAFDSAAVYNLPQCIVVGIDNGGDSRIAEYTPWAHPKHGGGQGDAYMRFITQTLKPYIDSAYRTRPHARYTVLGGSSLGAHISLYGGLKYPDVFGKLLLFSPAFWINPEIYRMIDTLKFDTKPAIYMMGSHKEGMLMMLDMQHMYKLLLERGWIEDQNLIKVERKYGEHKEWFWRKEFPEAVRWLFLHNE